MEFNVDKVFIGDASQTYLSAMNKNKSVQVSNSSADCRCGLCTRMNGVVFAFDNSGSEYHRFYVCFDCISDMKNKFEKAEKSKTKTGEEEDGA